MVITLSGVTGAGKSYFKKIIEEKLNLENQIIYTTRPIRNNEIDGVDKYFISDDKFNKLEKENKIMVTFEFLNNRYGYESSKMLACKDSIIELHYSIIYKLKQEVKDVCSIYIIPNNIQIAKEKLKERCLSFNQEMDRIKEIDEQIEEFNNNENLRNQFDFIVYNEYDEKSINNIIEKVKSYIKKEEAIYE